MLAPPIAAAGFQRGSPTHLLTLLACAALIVALVAAGRWARRNRPPWERRGRIAWVAATLAFQLWSQTWQNLPGNFDVRFTLPLHLCDLVIVAIPFGLLGRSRLARDLLFFWGAGLTLFAFGLPILREGPAHVAFWLFWIGHLQILASALYLFVVLGFRPGTGDVGRAVAVTALYVALLVPLNGALGTDYGSVGPDPSSTEMLGPWPWRSVLLLGLEALLFALIGLAARHVGRRLRPASEAEEP